MWKPQEPTRYPEEEEPETTADSRDSSRTTYTQEQTKDGERRMWEIFSTTDPEGSDSTSTGSITSTETGAKTAYTEHEIYLIVIAVAVCVLAALVVGVLAWLPCTRGLVRRIGTVVLFDRIRMALSE